MNVCVSVCKSRNTSIYVLLSFLGLLHVLIYVHIIYISLKNVLSVLTSADIHVSCAEGFQGLISSSLSA